ncbi:MAG: hypothetical protein RL417_728 [Pseudomonadota bacterium]|jgi:phosphoglycolate phosphatase-like HAD superfamily hydrolase
MTDLGHNSPSSPQRDDNAQGLNASAPRAAAAKKLDPLKEVRAFDKDTRKELVRLGTFGDPPLTLKSSMPFPQLAEALQRAPAEKRVEFITPFSTAGLNEPHLKSYILDKLPFVLQHLSTSEKGDLIRHLFDSKEGRRRDRYELAAEVFRACDDFHDLKDLCRNVGSQFIRRTKSAQMLDILARYEIIDSLRGLRIRPPLPRSAKIEHAEVYLDELAETLKEARRIVHSDPLLAHTPFGKRMRNIIDSNVRFIKKERDDADDAEDFRELANSVASKMKLEFRFGVAVTLRQERGQRLVEPWSTAELSELSTTLRRFPECLIILSKNLETIRKAPDAELSTAKETVYGLWTEGDGTIQLREGLHADTETRKAYGNKSPLGVILTHEFAHVYESDRGYDISQAKLEDGRNPPLYHSSEYRQISGWSVVDPSKYRITHGGKSAVIAGVSYRLDHDVAKLGGKDVFLVYHADTRTMFSYPMRAEWSLDDYSRANPSEDFAVSFAEYFRLPKQLAEFAPSKFLLFEHHFQEYAAKPEIMAAVRSSRASRAEIAADTDTRSKKLTERRATFESFMLERFDQMTRGEQAWVLANLRFRKEERTDTSQIYPLYRALKEVPAPIRRAQFVSFNSEAENYKEISDVMLDILKPYKQANLALLAARVRGAEIGVLTLRSSREGNAAHLDAIERFSGYSFSPRNLYFLSDEKFNERIRHIPGGPAKKAYILGEFANGEYRTASGESNPLRQRYGRVIFYEDETRNLEAARQKAAEFPDGRLVVIDANRASPEGIWRSICTRLLNGSPREPNSTREIVFFDLDGTMFDVAASIRIVHRPTQQILRTLSQPEFSTKPEAAWLNEVLAANPAIERSELTFDFDDFKLPERISEQVSYPRHLRRKDSPEIRRENRRKRTGRAAE